ncbi:hypothetical protein [Herbiconiux sp. YIM B11900]|uniref:hypothetical protein n=1 Tax=Herbiconiux sp. YIM B11900 TaxID=3404131 RepID=UPI003F86BE6D
MIGFVIALLVIWIVLAVLGFAIKGLLWLAILALILFVATAIFGYIRRSSKKV